MGVIGIAENKTIVRLLKLPIHPIYIKKIKNFNGIILIDTQAQTGYNPLPEKIIPVAVIDHHPLKNTTKASFIDIRKEVGATATIIAEYFIKNSIEIPANLATALFYGIDSETQALGREATQADIDA